MTNVKIINGQTWHGRRGKVENDFKYSIDYLLFDPDSLNEAPWLLSKKGGWFYGINQDDYGGLNDLGNPKKWVNKILESLYPKLIIFEPQFNKKVVKIKAFDL